MNITRMKLRKLLKLVHTIFQCINYSNPLELEPIDYFLTILLSKKMLGCLFPFHQIHSLIPLINLIIPIKLRDYKKEK